VRDWPFGKARWLIIKSTWRARFLRNGTYRAIPIQIQKQEIRSACRQSGTIFEERYREPFSAGDRMTNCSLRISPELCPPPLSFPRVEQALDINVTFQMMIMLCSSVLFLICGASHGIAYRKSQQAFLRESATAQVSTHTLTMPG